MKALIPLTLAALALSSTAASAQQAQRWPNWYVGIHADTSFVPNQDTDLNGTHLGNLHLDQGFGGGASIGYMPGGTTQILNSMRFEAEYNYNDASLDKFSGISLKKSERLNNYMFNAFYDFNFDGGFVPYIGGGVGIGNVHLNSGPIGGVDDSDTVFVWQLMAGLGYAPQMAPNTVLTLGYKYLDTSDPTYHSAAGKIDGEYSSHNIELGARFAF